MTTKTMVKYFIYTIFLLIVDDVSIDYRLYE